MKKKAVRYFAGFLIIMLVCTVVSRMVYAYQLPKVGVGSAEAKTISHKIEEGGRWIELTEKAVNVPAGIRVEEVCIQRGDHVEKGSILFRLDAESLKEQIDTIEQKISLMKEKIEAMEYKQNRKKELLITRNQEDLALVKKEQAQLIAKYKRTYEQAKKKYYSYISFKKYKKEAFDANAEYQTLKSAAKRKDALQADKDAFALYKKTSELSLKKEWNAKKKELESAMEIAADNLADAKDTAEESNRVTGKKIAKAQESYKEACRELEEYVDFSTYLANAKAMSLEYMNAMEKAQKAGASDAEKRAFQNYEQSFNDTTRKNWENGKAVLVQAVQTAKDALEVAQKEVNDQKTLQNDALKEAEDRYNNANRAVTAFPTKQDYIEEEENTNTEYQSLKAAAGNSESDRQAFEAYKAAFETAMGEEWENKKRELESELAAADENRKRVKENTGENLSEKNTLLSEAQSSYDAACKQLSMYSDYNTYLQKAKAMSSEYATLKEAADASEDAKKEFIRYDKVFEMTAKKEWDNGKKILSKAVKSAREVLEEVSDDAVSEKKAQDKLVAKAQKKYDSASEEVSNFDTLSEYIKNAEDMSLEYQNLKKAAERKTATAAEKKAFKIFSKNLEKTLKREWNAAKSNLHADKAKASMEWKEAKESRKLTIYKLLLANKRALEDLELENLDRNLEKKELEQTISNLEKQYEQYHSIYQSGGNIKNSCAGTVENINISVGNMTADGAAVTIKTDHGIWSFCANLTEEECKYLDVGVEVTIFSERENGAEQKAKISSLTEGEAGNYRVNCEIKGEKKIAGILAKMKYEPESGHSDCCVPLTALYADTEGSYVLVLKEHESFLGKEFTVEKLSVQIEDKNSDSASLKNSPLNEEDKIVIMADKEIRSGDAVRIMEEN